MQTQWGKSPDLPGANSLVSVGVFVLNFKVLKKDPSRRRKLGYGVCVNIYSRGFLTRAFVEAWRRGKQRY